MLYIHFGHRAPLFRPSFGVSADDNKGVYEGFVYGIAGALYQTAKFGGGSYCWLDKRIRAMLLEGSGKFVQQNSIRYLYNPCYLHYLAGIISFLHRDTMQATYTISTSSISKLRFSPARG